MAWQGVARWSPAVVAPNAVNRLVEESEIVFTSIFGAEALLKVARIRVRGRAWR